MGPQSETRVRAIISMMLVKVVMMLAREVSSRRLVERMCLTCLG